MSVFSRIYLHKTRRKLKHFHDCNSIEEGRFALSFWITWFENSTKKSTRDFTKPMKQIQSHHFAYYCEYRISSYSFRGNYSFLNLEIQRSQYIRPKVTVHRGAETIQGRKLFKGGNYMRKYGMYVPRNQLKVLTY